MTGHVGYHLGRFSSPRFLAVVHLFHIYLRMADASHNAELQALHFNIAIKLSRLFSIQTTQPSCDSVIAERTTQGIAHLVAKSSNTWHLGDICLHAQLFRRQGTLSGTPPLTIDKDRGVEFVKFSTYRIHGLNVMTTHQVKTETIDTILVVPILCRLYHKLTHHRLFRCRLVATA